MSDILRQQIEYYRARAGEYDQWFLRQGRYDRGPDLNAQWFAEADTLAEAVAAFSPEGHVLELAGGTGIWTDVLARTAATLTVVDSSQEVLTLNRQRVGRDDIDYVMDDIFSWRPDRSFDTAFFAFWLSHVPPDRFEEFWDLVRDILRPDGRFFLIDSLYDPASTAGDHTLPHKDATVTMRRLNDGREFEIYKVFYAPDALARRLSDLGWSATVKTTGSFFFYAHGTPR